MAGTEIPVSMNIHIHLFIYLYGIYNFIYTLRYGGEREVPEEIKNGTCPACAKSNTQDSRPGSEFINSAGDCIGMKR